MIAIVLRVAVAGSLGLCAWAALLAGAEARTDEAVRQEIGFTAAGVWLLLLALAVAWGAVGR